MTPVWPNDHLNQRQYISNLNQYLRVVEQGVRVATSIQSGEPTESDLNDAWSTMMGQVSQVPQGGKVQWFRPDRNSLMSLFARIGNEGLSLDGLMTEVVARPKTFSNALLHYDFINSPVATIDIAIPQTYKDLLIFMKMRGTAAAAEIALNVRFNGVSSANYYRATISANGAAAIGAESLGQTQFSMQIPAANSHRRMYSDIVMLVPRYTRTLRKPSLCVLHNMFRDPITSIASDDKFFRNHTGMLNIAGAVTTLNLSVGSDSIDRGGSILVLGLK